MFTQGPVSIYKSGRASGGKWWRTIFADGGLKSLVMSLESYRNTITAFRDVSVSMSYWYREVDRPVSPVISRSLPFQPMLPFSRTIINYRPIVFSIGVYCPLTQHCEISIKSVRSRQVAGGAPTIARLLATSAMIDGAAEFFRRGRRWGQKLGKTGLSPELFPRATRRYLFAFYGL